MYADLHFPVEAKGLEPSNLLTASQALYQLSYAPGRRLRLSGWSSAASLAGFYRGAGSCCSRR